MSGPDEPLTLERIFAAILELEERQLERPRPLLLTQFQVDQFVAAFGDAEQLAREVQRMGFDGWKAIDRPPDEGTVKLIALSRSGDVIVTEQDGTVLVTERLGSTMLLLMPDEVGPYLAKSDFMMVDVDVPPGESMLDVVARLVAQGGGS